MPTPTSLTNPLPSQAPSSFAPAFGGKPAVPDPADVLQSVIASNLGMMGDIKGLGKKASKYFWNQTIGRVPGYQDMSGQSAANIAAQLRGEIPADVLYQIGQGAAQRGITRGGGFSNADYLRSLGLTSLGLMAEGEKGLTGALQRAESVPLFDISKYMLNPQDVYQSQLLANIYAAAPDPASAAAAANAALNRGARSATTTPGRLSGMPSLGRTTPAPEPGFDWNAWSLGQTAPSTTQVDPWNPWGTTGWMGGAGVPSYIPQEEDIFNYGLPGGTIEGPESGTGEGSYGSYYDDFADFLGY